MSHMRMEFPSTEGVLLVRRDGVTMAIHLTSVVATLEAVIIEHPDVELGYATLYGGTTLDHYAVEATGNADRLYVWQGPDPFAKTEIENPRAEVES